jgi:surface protein
MGCFQCGNNGSMFYKATSFNQELSVWNVSAVKDMSYMFYGASSFDKPLSTWDVSNVETMQAMFYDATSFNQELLFVERFGSEGYELHVLWCIFV